MRLWSIHPEYLDRKGFLGVWREGLLAKKVLEGKTKGYKNHPQLTRFKKYKKPLLAINTYLTQIYNEGRKRGYKLDKNKIEFINLKKIMFVSSKQVEFEFKHLLKKLKLRDRKKYKELLLVKKPKVNPIFKVRIGKIEKWEKDQKIKERKGRENF